MSNPGNAALSEYDQRLVEAFRAYQEHGSESVAARKAGVPRHTFSNRLLRYFLRGLDGRLPMTPLAGHIVKTHAATFNAAGELTSQSVRTGLAGDEDGFELPEGYRIKGESVLLDAQNNVVQRWVKTREDGGLDPEEIARAAEIAATLYAPAQPSRVPAPVEGGLDPDLLNFYPLPDLHLGAHLNGATAETTWTLEMAVDTCLGLFEDLIARSPPAAEAVILGGGDLLHADDDLRETRQSKNKLEVAEPYGVVLAHAQNMTVRMVELALAKHERVTVRILPGNHDPDSAIAVSHYLKAWFRHEPRVTVDADLSLFWFFSWGKVMLGATHGHMAKINEMPGIMAADRRAMWGQAEVAYAHGFHIHHATKGFGDGGGASWETHETPAPRDTYHQGKAYRSARSLVCITYCAEAGEVERTRASVRRLLRGFRK